MTAPTMESGTLPNGLEVIIEEMPDVQSAAFTLLIPAGSIHEPKGANGTSAALCDLTMRGAGELDNRALSTVLDDLGVQRHEHVGWNFLAYNGAMLADNLPTVLGIYADIARKAHLPEEEFEPVMSGLTQGLLALEDEPQRKLTQELLRRTYVEPWGRPSEGSLAELPNVSMKTVRGQYERCFRPNGAILGVAGRVKAAEIRQLVAERFGGWKRQPVDEPVVGHHRLDGDHVEHPSTQVQIGVAYPAPPYGHPDYYAAWAAASVLGGGPSARLFTEVRERRGLCYSVQSSLHSLKAEGRTIVYAGTTAERAQETLDVTMAEVQKLGQGIGADELQRCQARAKSALVMQQESTLARASSLARDWFHLGRVTTLEEVKRSIEELTVESVLDAVDRYPPKAPTIVTVGPVALRVA